MQLLEQSEATAARRRIPFECVSDVDERQALTGLTFTAAEIQVSKAGAAEANSAGTVTEVGGGGYYYEATAGELDTFGVITIRPAQAGIRRTIAPAQVVAFDPFAAAWLTAAQVNAEVLDVLNVDAFAEIGQEAPAATQTLRKMVAFLYKLARNRVTQTATTLKVYADDATTVDQKATVSDDTVTYDRGELGAGP